MNKDVATFLANYPQLLLCEIGANGGILQMTDALCFLLAGKTSFDESTSSLFSFLHPEDAEEALAAFEVCLANKLDVLSFRARTRMTDPVLLEFSGRFSNYRFYLSVEEIERKHAEHEIREQVDKLVSDASGISQIGHWHLDLREKELIWSDEVFTIHGVSKDEYQPDLQSAIEFYHPDDVEYVESSISQSIATGAEWHSRLRIVRPDGGVRSVIVASNVITNQKGKAITLFGVIQDVTEAEEIEQERRLMAGAFESTHLGLVITDTNRRVMYANQGFEELTGYAATEVQGHSLGRLLQGKKTSQKTIKQIRASLNESEKVDCVILNYSKDKTPYWNHLVITPIFRNGELVNFVGVQQDVTEEVETRKEIDELNNSLEHIVTERTEKLKEANEKLKRLSIEDPLTGALNRRAFYQGYNTEAKRAGRSGQPLSLALMDLDFFKKINDKYGHIAGDKVLKSVVEIINDNMRETDYLFRMGGEEFLLLMSNTGMVQAKIVCERIRKSIAANVIHQNDKAITVTVSTGLISHVGDVSVSDSLRMADETLYQAKESGRNKVVSEVD